jgi:hypothetical protein
MADEPWDLTKPAESEVPSTPAPPVVGGALRASDHDRNRTAEWLTWAAGTGQLTMDEFDERLASAYAARTVDELRVLTSDLQPRPVAPGPERSLGERARARIPAALPLLVPIMFLLLVSSVALSHGDAAFPWLFVGGIFLVRRRFRRHSWHHRHPHGH